jgi:hypothetical protein
MRNHSHSPASLIQRKMTSTLFSFCLVLGAIMLSHIPIGAAADAAGASQFVLSDKKLEDMVVYLRGGDDYGLVRPGPSDVTYERQLETDGPCGRDKLATVLDVLLQDESQALSTRGKAVELVVLCTANQPQHRAFIGGYKNGKVLDEIVELVKGATHVHQSDNMLEEVEVAALAGEAIWILSFASAANHAAFIHNNKVIPVLADVMMNCDITPVCAHAQMWAAGALQNLM